MTSRIVFLLSLLVALFIAATPAVANEVHGQLVVEGKTIEIHHVYAFAEKDFFHEERTAVVVVMCDNELPEAAVRDAFERDDLIKAGKAHCVEQTINQEHQVINFKVQHERFEGPASGGSTEHVFEATTYDGKTIAGRSYTKGEQKSFDDVPYSYDITFRADVAAMEE